MAIDRHQITKELTNRSYRDGEGSVIRALSDILVGLYYALRSGHWSILNVGPLVRRSNPRVSTLSITHMVETSGLGYSVAARHRGTRGVAVRSLRRGETNSYNSRNKVKDQERLPRGKRCYQSKGRAIKSDVDDETHVNRVRMRKRDRSRFAGGVNPDPAALMTSEV